MSTPLEKVDRVERMRYLMEVYENNQLAPQIREILLAMGLCNERYFLSGGYEKAYNNGSEIEVVFSGSCRGSDWTDRFQIPITIMRSPDPTAAAQAWKICDDERKAAEKITQRQKEITAMEAKLTKLKEVS